MEHRHPVFLCRSRQPVPAAAVKCSSREEHDKIRPNSPGELHPYNCICDRFGRARGDCRTLCYVAIWEELRARGWHIAARLPRGRSDHRPNTSVGHAIWSLDATVSGVLLALMRGVLLVGLAYWLSSYGAVGLAGFPTQSWLSPRHWSAVDSCGGCSGGAPPNGADRASPPNLWLRLNRVVFRLSRFGKAH